MRYLRLTATCIAAVLLPLIALGCSSSDSDADAAARADQDAGVATEAYELKQTFDLNMELTSSVFNRIRRIPIEYTCTANSSPMVREGLELDTGRRQVAAPGMVRCAGGHHELRGPCRRPRRLHGWRRVSKPQESTGSSGTFRRTYFSGTNRWAMPEADRRNAAWPGGPRRRRR